MAFPTQRAKYSRLDYDNYDEKKQSRFAWWYNATFVGITILVQVASTVIIVLFMNASSADYDPSNTNFKFYKNSRFKECITQNISVETNCTMIHGKLLTEPNVDRWYMDAVSDGMNFLSELRYAKNASAYAADGSTDPIASQSYSWCDMVSCLSDFEVIPSSPKPSAYGYSGIMIWANLNMITLLAMLATEKFLDKTTHKWTECPGFGLRFWAGNIFSLATFIFWCYSFAGVVANPHDAAPISIVAWVTLWVLASSTEYHPLSCWLGSRPRTRKIVVMTLSVLAVLHWVACCVILGIDWIGILGSINTATGTKMALYPVYNCLESEILNSTGTLRCSAAEICAKDWLFSNPGFNINGDVSDMGINNVLLIFTFIGLSLAFWPAIFGFIWKRLGESGGSAAPFGPQIPITVTAGGSSFIITLVVLIGIHDWSEWDRQALVAYDYDCMAAHVTMSPWKQYLDVDNYGRALRIAKMWFNS